MLDDSTFLDVHPIAKEMPGPDDELYADMVRDIRANGLKRPIVLFEGKILDGRIRYRACLKAGVTPIFEEFEGNWNEAIDYVIRENLLRRSLDQSQRAVVAAELAKMRQGERNDLRQSRRKSQAQTAKQCQVGTRYVTAAKLILDTGHAPLKRMIMAGELSVNAAEEIVRATPADELTNVVDLQSVRRRQRQIAKEKRQAAGLPVLLLTMDLLERTLASLPSLRALREGLPGSSAQDRDRCKRVLTKLATECASRAQVVAKFEGSRPRPKQVS